MHVMGFPLGFAESLSAGSMIFLVAALGLALAFEFVNGFHDTANAVATVIYTHALPPWIAVIWSGLWNLTGVLTSSGLVAYTIVSLLPVELVINVGSGAGFAMIFALLVSAILWNLGTWYLGLPASSTHTLTGAILGVGLANALVAGHPMMQGVNWEQVKKVFVTLAVSPVVGFVCAGLLLLILKYVIPNKAMFQPPAKDAPPPWWICIILVCTCTGVSYYHGSNDGQKGIGLLLLILIGILPAEYALNLNSKPSELQSLQASAALVQPLLNARAASAGINNPPPTVVSHGPSDLSTDQQIQNNPLEHGEPAELNRFLQNGAVISDQTFSAAAVINQQISDTLKGKQALRDVAIADRTTLRTDLFLLDQTVAKLMKTKAIGGTELAAFKTYGSELDGVTKYTPPTWIKVAVACALGFGTMIGWKRIVRTVGEKIGKEHLNYAQGMAAEIVAMATIKAADNFGLPVSTTHVLSSGVAGTMAANRSGLQAATLRNIALAWLLTLPVCVILGAMTFSAGLYIVIKQLVPQTTVVLAAVALLLIARRIWIKVKTASNPPVADPAA
jgi:inorganic phosphate transporter, PiT family